MTTFNLNFLSDDTLEPNITNPTVANANIGAIFLGNTNNVYTRINKTTPPTLDDWLKIYTPENNPYFIVNNDIINILETLLFSGTNGLTITANNLTQELLFSGNILSGTIVPSGTPSPSNKNYFYIRTTTNELYLWNTSSNTWQLLSFGTVDVTDNLNGTYTINGITFDGTDDQDTTEITVSPSVDGETNLETLLTNLTNSTYNVSAPFAQFEVYDKKGLGLTVKSFSQGIGTLTYLWSTSDGSATISNPTSQNTNIIFSTVGSHTITLTITDGNGTIGSSDKLVYVDKIIFVGGLQATYYSLSDAITWMNANISSGDIPNWSIYVEGTTTDSSVITLNKAKLHIRFYGKISSGLVINSSGTYNIVGTTVYYPAINAGNNIGIDISANSVTLNLTYTRIESTISFSPIINITGTSCIINATGLYIKGSYGILTNSSTTLNLNESFIEATKCAGNLIGSTLNINNLVIDSFANLHSTDNIDYALFKVNECKGIIKGCVINGVADGSTPYYAMMILPSTSYTDKLYFFDGYVKLTGFSTITNGTNIVSALFCKDNNSSTQEVIVRNFGCNSSAVALTMVSSSVSTALSFYITMCYFLGAAALLINNSGNTIDYGTNQIRIYKNTLNGSVLST